MENSLILFVEDNPDDAKLTLKALRMSKIENDTVLAADGVEALDYLFGTGNYAERDTSVMPRFILLDLKLPKVDGLEVIRRVRDSETTRLIPIVVLTASGERRDILDSYRLGANAYIRKPVDFVQFVEALRHTCEFWLMVNEPLPPQKRP